MASTRLRLASLFAATVIVVGACSSTPKASGPAASGGTAMTARRLKGDNAAAGLQVPDMVGRQVQRRDSPDRPLRRRRLDTVSLRWPTVRLQKHSR